MTRHTIVEHFRGLSTDEKLELLYELWDESLRTLRKGLRLTLSGTSSKSGFAPLSPTRGGGVPGRMCARTSV